MDTLGSGIGQETLQNIENEKCTLQDLEYGKKPEKREKTRHTHWRTWKMARNTEICGK